MNGREKVKGVKKSTSQGKKLMETEKGSTALKLEIFFSFSFQTIPSSPIYILLPSFISILSLSTFSVSLFLIQ